MDLQRLQQLAGLPLTESKQILTERYEESADFDADYEQIQKHLAAAKKIVESANWKKHLSDTDKNFDTECVTYSGDALKSLNEAIAAFTEFYNHIEKAA